VGKGLLVKPPPSVVAKFPIRKGQELAGQRTSSMFDIHAVSDQLRLLKSAIDHASDSILVFDVNPRDPRDRLIAYANEAFYQTTGFRPEELADGTLRELIGRDTDQNVLREAIAKLERGETMQIEVVLYRKDRSSFWASVTTTPIQEPDGSIRHWIAVAYDITQKKKREQRLEILSEAVDMATNLVFVTDGVPPSRGGPHLTWANRAFLEEMGYSLDEILGSTPAIFYGPETDRNVAKGLRDAIEMGRDASAEYIVYRKDGSGVWVEFSGRLIRSAADKRERWIAVGRNVTDRRTAQQRLEEFSHALETTNEKLREANRHRADLVAMLAHDVKNPITAIVGFSQLLAGQEIDPTERAEALETIQSTAQRLAKLATDTLTMSELERNDMPLSISTVDIVQLLDEIVRMHHNERTIELKVTPPEKAITIQGDRERLMQAIDNVVINSLKYSSDPISIDLEVTADICKIQVSDRGIGIPDSEITKLFQRFSRASNARKTGIRGSGFGLYLVKSIVERHHGHVEISSQENIGTILTITLPVSQPI
jgi:PAS domain S-box-containing protein